MSRTPVVYRLEAQRFKDAAWEPVLDHARQPLTWNTPAGKAQAIAMAEIVRRYPSWWGVRVRRNDTVVKEWTRKDDQAS